MLRVFPIYVCSSIALFVAFGLDRDPLQSKVNVKDQPAMTPDQNAANSLADKINESLKVFSSEKEPRNDFTKMVMDWRTGDGKPLLLTLKKKHDISLVKDVSMSQKDSDRSEVDRSIIKELCEGLRSAIVCDPDTRCFEQTVETKTANLFDYTVIFKILADSIGLNAHVVEYMNGPDTSLDCIYQHLRCMVFLDEGKVELVSLNDYSMGSPFVLSEHYEKNGNCWRPLKHEKDYRGTFFVLNSVFLSEYASFENATSHLSDADYELAIKEIDKFIEACPNSTLGYLTKAGFLYQVKEVDRALDTLEEAIRIYPEFDIAYCRRSMLYSEMGHSQQAMKELNKAIEVNPTAYRTFSARAAAHYEIGELTESMADYNSAIRLNGEVAELYIFRGDTYLKMKQYENALSDFTKAIELKPDSKMAYACRVKTKRLMGREQDAEDDLRKFQELIRTSERK